MKAQWEQQYTPAPIYGFAQVGPDSPKLSLKLFL